MALNITPRARRAALAAGTGVAACLLVLGAVLFAYPYYTDYRASQTQEELSAELETAELKKAFEERNVPVASPVSRLLIPKLGVNTVVVEGTHTEALDAGAGHYSQSKLPGEIGNIAIAGHRVTYGRPFHDLDKLVPGDQVILETPVGPYVYEMVPPFDGHANPWVIAPDDWSVIRDTPEPMLTLTTCHPKGSARQRLVARLKLVDSPADESLAA
jgi:sortase A